MAALVVLLDNVIVIQALLTEAPCEIVVTHSGQTESGGYAGGSLLTRLYISRKTLRSCGARSIRLP